MKKLYLVDVSSMFFRAFFALPPMSNSSGLPTNALYGLLSMTIKLLRDIKPDYMAFCFDRKEPSFRAEIYPEYKAHREEMPEALQPQVSYIRQLTEMLGIPAIDKETFEADDIIGSLARYGREQGLEVIIVSGDKDFAQLVAPFVSMYDTMKDVRYDTDGVLEKWGVHPEQMIDYLAMVGDASDNIPGVRGIGPKNAQKLLAEFKTLEGIYANLDKISGKATRKKLEEGRENAFLSQRLVTIKCDIDTGLSLNDLRLRPIDRDRLRELLTELEFRTFERSLLGDAAPARTEVVAKKEASSTSRSAATQPQVTQAPPVSIGKLTEQTWSLEDLRTNIKPYSEVWAILNERGFFLGYSELAITVSADEAEIGQALNAKHINWKGFDLKESWKCLQLQSPLPPAMDLMLAAYVVRAGSIEDFASVYREYTGKLPPDLASFADIYRCHLELEAVLSQKLDNVKGWRVLNEIEHPLVPVLYQMETTGIFVDRDQLSELSRELDGDIKKLEQNICDKAGEPFNVASPKQLSQVLFEKLGLPAGKKTKTGYSTSNDVLERLALDHEIARDVINFRELSKLKSTYVDSLPQLINAATGKLHTRFRQATTSTGRLSSVNPNLQNIPIRTDRGRLVRKAFVADHGKKFISADYSQIELRILAHISDDPGLIKAFEEDKDIHAATASEIFGSDINSVTADQRRIAKAVNFGIAYGQGAFGLSEALGVSRAEATDIIDKYFRKFNGVRDYMHSIVESAKEKGFVETLFGRRRYIKELESKNGNIRKFGERAAINAPIQGTASDIVKKAMVTIYESVEIPMLLQVHDELVFECPDDKVGESSQRICQLMESAVKLKVPLKVNVAAGQNWEDAHA